MDTLATRRVFMLARLAFVWAMLIAGRLIWLQIVQHGDFQRLAQQQQEKVVELQAPRGAIVDRLGQRLALSLPVESVCVDPLKVPDRAVAAEILSRILDVDANELLRNLQWAVDNRRGFLWVKRRVTPEEAAREIDFIGRRAETEVSGGVTLDNVRAYAEARPDFISAGSITHSAVAVDINCRIHAL